MNTDPEDTGLLIGAGVSIALFGFCLFGVLIRDFICKRPRIKESRSDNDLANMLEKGESS
jgi:hypothetical protein